jgi:hypothetical protein
VYRIILHHFSGREGMEGGREGGREEGREEQSEVLNIFY